MWSFMKREESKGGRKVKGGVLIFVSLAKLKKPIVNKIKIM
jgi:hypothetical protein